MGEECSRWKENGVDGENEKEKGRASVAGSWRDGGGAVRKYRDRAMAIVVLCNSAIMLPRYGGATAVALPRRLPRILPYVSLNYNTFLSYILP